LIHLPGGEKLSIALTLICKNEDETLAQLFESLKPCLHVFDEILVGWNGDNQKTKVILDRFSTRIVPTIWKNHHGDLRQQIHDLATSELVCWFDADDTLDQAEDFASVTSQAFSDPSVGALWLDYLYRFDPNGLCVMKMKRERVVRRKWYKWVGALHENLLCDGLWHRTAADMRVKPMVVRHHTDEERLSHSGERCLTIAKAQIEREQEAGAIDPRTVLDYARALTSVGEDEKAIKIFEKYIEISGWDDMRYVALNTMADLHKNANRFEQAKHCYHLAMIMKPRWPDAYVGLAQVAMQDQQWPDVVFFCQILQHCDTPQGIIPCDPTSWTIAPLKMLHFAYANLGEFDKAAYVAREAMKFYPEDHTLQQCAEAYEKGLRHLKLQAALEDVKDWLEQHDQSPKLAHLIQAIPDEMKDTPEFVRLKNQLFPPNEKNRVVIYCGDSYEKWDHRNADAQGIGGSEEAVIHLSRALAAKGWVVDVYGNVESESTVDGVRWRYWHTYDPEGDPGDIFVAWRLPEYLDFIPLVNTKTRLFLWCHDVQLESWWNAERLKRVEKVILLSEAHRETCPWIPLEKITFSRNGIIPERHAMEKPRDLMKCVYLSSPDRGLETILEEWPKIKAEVPQAKLDVYYGFTKNFDELSRGNASQRAYKAKMMKLLQQPGIRYLGRRPQTEIEEAVTSSNLFLYPCRFFEISCISAMRAQAGGAIPVTIQTAALKETVQHGVRIEGDWNDPEVMTKWRESVIDLLQHPEKTEAIREPMRRWALENFSWDAVSDQWDAMFKPEAVHA